MVPFEWTGREPPDYRLIYAWRLEQRKRFCKEPTYLLGAKEFYAKNPAAWITRFVDTIDPRNAMIDLPTRLPFVLFKRQEELIDFLFECVTDETSGLIDKSRDMGATWLLCAFSAWLWIFRSGAAIGWGSRKEQLVDRLGDPDSIFEKMRLLIRGLPPEFLPRGFEPDKHLTYMKIINPENDSVITGESGDNIGRGGRKLLYIKDECAFYEHPESIEAALGDNTRVQMDVSTPHGIGTVFDRKRNAGTIWTPGCKIPKGALRIFELDWSDHPAKTQEWHDQRLQAAKDAGLSHLFYAEVDRNPAASVEGIIIPADWVNSAVDAHIKLKFTDEGRWGGALDVADEGGDLNALVFRKGVVLHSATDWGEGDVGATTRKTISAAREYAPIAVQYDSVGIGAAVKAEYNRLIAERSIPRDVTLVPWSAGAKVLNPESRVIKGDPKSPLVQDFYANFRGQAWWELRLRFERTHRAIREGIKYDPEQLISLSSKIPKLSQLKRELSQPVVAYDSKLRLSVDKKPEGSKSPNLGDAIAMCYFPARGPIKVSAEALEYAMGDTRRR